jgi:tRNA A64-2'-O-ribosylphosphate transferase
VVCARVSTRQTPQVCPRKPTQVTKQLKRQRASLYNCVCSIVDDAVFVEELSELWPGVPLIANLRCGAWYVPPHFPSSASTTAAVTAAAWPTSSASETLPVAAHCDAGASSLQGAAPTAIVGQTVRAGRSISTCYFKSTDGHMSNWSFSPTRLNLHVAQVGVRTLLGPVRCLLLLVVCFIHEWDDQHKSGLLTENVN